VRGCGEEDPTDDRLAVGPPLAFVPDDAVACDWMVRSATRRAIWLVTPGLFDDFECGGESFLLCLHCSNLSLQSYGTLRIIMLVSDSRGATSVSEGHPSQTSVTRPGRPRSDKVHRAILDATRDLIVEHGFADLRLEHVAARAGVGKSTIYRRWASKEELALELLLELASPHITIENTGNTREELTASVDNAIRGLTRSAFGPVIRALLSHIAVDPALGDPFRATVVQARRTEIAAVIARGIERGDLRSDVEVDIATELLVGPVYFRLMFGGELNDEFATNVVDTLLQGFSTAVRSSLPQPGSFGTTQRSKPSRRRRNR
jgi:AcrR family transcriptional regulator